MPKVYRAKAPLRLGLAGGGTDLAAYASQFGGAILNATIAMYAHASVEPLNDSSSTAQPLIEFISPDRRLTATLPLADQLPIHPDFPLHCGVFNRLVKDFGLPVHPFRLTTSVDAPPGSGLGSSSTLVVAMIAAFAEWRRIPLGEYEIAQLAYEIEREDLGMAGGKQDQFAAAFGGFNFMEFLRDGSVLVNPLRIKPELVCELEQQMILLHTKTSRYSSHIIEEQVRSVSRKGGDRMEALHQIKESAFSIKRALLLGDMRVLGKSLHEAWLQKKRTAAKISSTNIEAIYDMALKSGAVGGKVSGAGGGGFMFFVCAGDTRYAVMEALSKLHVTLAPCHFVHHGCISWTARA